MFGKGQVRLESSELSQLGRGIKPRQRIQWEANRSYMWKKSVQLLFPEKAPQRICEIEAVSVGSFAARCFCRGVGLVRDGMDNLFATELDLTGTLASSQPFRSSTLPACTWPSISISGFLSSPVENWVNCQYVGLGKYHDSSNNVSAHL